MPIACPLPALRTNAIRGANGRNDPTVVICERDAKNFYL
jgi:hypothetical protein